MNHGKQNLLSAVAAARSRLDERRVADDGTLVFSAPRKGTRAEERLSVAFPIGGISVASFRIHDDRNRCLIRKRSCDILDGPSGILGSAAEKAPRLSLRGENVFEETLDALEAIVLNPIEKDEAVSEEKKNILRIIHDAAFPDYVEKAVSIETGTPLGRKPAFHAHGDAEKMKKFSADVEPFLEALGLIAWTTIGMGLRRVSSLSVKPEIVTIKPLAKLSGHEKISARLRCMELVEGLAERKADEAVAESAGKIIAMLGR
jgi:hypothetical protein